MNTEKTTTTDKSFRTAEDVEKTKSAAGIVARAQAAVDAAKTELSAAESAYTADPSAKALDRAKSARRALTEAEADLGLARQHQSKVASEVRSAERARIEAEIARREADLTVVVDDDTLEAAVDLAVRSIELQRRVEARAEQHLSELEALGELRKLIGANSDDAPAIPPVYDFINRACVRLGEVGLASQAQLGVRANDPPRAFGFGMPWPRWRQGNGAREFLTGLEEFHVHGADGNGVPITTGTKRTDLVDEAKALIERVKARRGDSGRSSLARGMSVAAAGASVLALAAGAAISLAGG